MIDKLEKIRQEVILMWLGTAACRTPHLGLLAGSLLDDEIFSLMEGK